MTREGIDTMEGYEPAHETIETEYNDINVGKSYLQRLPKEALDEHDLRETLIDCIVSQGDTAITLTDHPVDSQGRFRVPSKKARLHGLDTDGRMSVFIDRVVAR